MVSSWTMAIEQSYGVYRGGINPIGQKEMTLRY